MSKYFDVYQKLLASQYQAIMVLAVVGLVLVVGWVVINPLVPYRWREITRWLYLMFCVAMATLTMLLLGG
jgi:hypothetical protein